MRSRTLPVWGLCFLASAALGASCIAVSPEGIHRQTDGTGGGGGAGGDPTILFDSGAPPENLDAEAGPSDPHATIGADPSHGPFAGGQRVLVRGKGFTSKVRVWLGANEVDQTQSIAVDPSHVQVVAPPGTAGLVDVSTQNGDDASTRRTLSKGYEYDALYADPATGPISGGNVVRILGQGTAWDATTTAEIDGQPCKTLSVVSPTELSCTAPAGTQGSKTIRVATGGTDVILVLDAYTYADSDNGYKGGLSGAALAGHLKVLVFDNYTGQAIPGAVVIVGTPDAPTSLEAVADAGGVAVFTDPSLTAPRTVTVAGKCHSPITFVADPVDTVTAYLDPVLDPACASSGDPPPVGGKPGDQATISGELVWTGQDEFKKALWTNVPLPVSDHEHQAAYVFTAAGDPTYAFSLPNAVSQVTLSSPGDTGYAFSVIASPGNRTLYAIAGIEDDTVSPPKFTAYAMGSVVGVPALPGQLTTSIYINMNKTLDQVVTMQVSPPAPGPKGPDRLRATVAVRLGADGYALLPAGLQQPLLPTSGDVTFVGLPSLDGSLAGSVFVSSAKAVTGASGSAPLSAIGRALTTSTSQVVDMSGFVAVPTLVAPKTGAALDGQHLEVSFPAGGPPLDVTVVDVQSGNGLYHWTIASPGGSQKIVLPDLSGHPDVALPSGPISIAVYGGVVDGFNYPTLSYADIRSSGMKAYSLDYFDAHY